MGWSDFLGIKHLIQIIEPKNTKAFTQVYVCSKNILEFFPHILFYVCLQSEQNRNYENFVKTLIIPVLLLSLYFVYVFRRMRIFQLRAWKTEEENKPEPEEIQELKQIN